MDSENMYDFLDNYEKENYSEENMGLKDNKISLTKIRFYPKLIFIYSKINLNFQN